MIIPICNEAGPTDLVLAGMAEWDCFGGVVVMVAGSASSDGVTEGGSRWAVGLRLKVLREAEWWG